MRQIGNDFFNDLLEAAQLAYDAALGEAQRLDDKAAEVCQAQVRAAYM